MTSALSHGPRARVASVLWGSAARELVATMLLGALGAGLVFLASRPGWAHVRTVPPRPLPASNVTVTGAQLVPYLDELALAGLATLAAVLATRGVLRRITGLLLAAIGAAVAAAAVTVTAASAIAAAQAGFGPAAASAGSVMAGSNAAPSAVPNVAGTIPHVTFSAAGWQAIVVAGALAMIAAGSLVIWRARRLAVMSSRYDAAPGVSGRGTEDPVSSGDHPRDHAARQRPADRRDLATAAADSASIWEALSRGQDPTAGSRQADA